MRVWNLSRLTDIEDQVVQSFDETSSHREPLGGRGVPPRFFRIAAGVTLAAATLFVPAASVNAAEVLIPACSPAASEQYEIAPPLNDMFVAQGDGLSSKIEDDLLARIEAKKQNQSVPIEQQRRNFVASNAYESPRDDAGDRISEIRRTRGRVK